MRSWFSTRYGVRATYECIHCVVIVVLEYVITYVVNLTVFAQSRSPAEMVNLTERGLQLEIFSE